MKAIIALFIICLPSLLPSAIAPSALSEEAILRHSEQFSTLPRFAIRFYIAYQAYQVGAYTKAARLWQQIMREHPDEPLLDYAYLYFGDSLLRAARYDDARQVFEYLQKTYPHSLLLPDVPFLIAESYYRQEAYDTAASHYLALKQDKRFQNHRWLPEVYVKLGDCYARQDQTPAAYKLYHQARLKFSAHPVYEQATRREAALIEQQPALLDQMTSQTALKEAETLIDAGRAADALPVLNRLFGQTLSAAPRAKVLLRLARANYVVRDNQRALALYRQFLDEFPTSKTAPYTLDRIGRLHLRQQNMAAFLEIYQRLRSEYPASRYTAAAMRLRGKELELLDRFEDALAEFQSFLQHFPKSSLVPDVLWHVGWVNFRLKRYDDALSTFSRLLRAYPKSSHQEETRYWAARAAENVKHYSRAADYYLALVNTNRNSYYGFLGQQALERLAQSHPELEASAKVRTMKPLPLDNEPRYTHPQAIRRRERAVALARMTFYRQAADELAAAFDYEKPTPAQHLELARLYWHGRQYHRLARLMRTHFWYWVVFGDDSLPAEFWKLMYPRSFATLVERAAAGSTLDPLAVTALMLAESVFDVTAYSPAGARGLMQLMPATGARMAEQAGIAAPAPDDYFRLEVNILLGATYLKHLLALFEQQLPPVIASYNAGEHVVSAWWRDIYHADIPAFVASIPYAQTKKYVQRVLWYYREYQRIYRATKKK